MSASARIVKFFNLFVAGVGQAGKIEELQLPNLQITEEDLRTGGMDAPIGIDVGMEKLECSFTLAGSDKTTLRQFGLAEGNNLQLIARSSLESTEGVKSAVTVVMTGKLKGIEPGAWQGGSKATNGFTCSLRYYRYEEDGEVIHEIDVENMVRVINGVDQLAQHRANIGLA